MENKNNEGGALDILYPDAYKIRIINEGGETFFLLEFGKALAVVPIGDEDVEHVARIAVSPDDLRLLFDRIVQTGLRFRPDFWNAFLQPGGGDCGDTPNDTPNDPYRG